MTAVVAESCFYLAQVELSHDAESASLPYRGRDNSPDAYPNSRRTAVPMNRCPADFKYDPRHAVQPANSESGFEMVQSRRSPRGIGGLRFQGGAKSRAPRVTQVAWKFVRETGQRTAGWPAERRVGCRSPCRLTPPRALRQPPA